MKNAKSNTGILFLLIGAILVMFLIVGATLSTLFHSDSVKPSLPMDAQGNTAIEFANRTELDKMVQSVTQRAVDASDPKICNELPLSGAVWEEKIDKDWGEDREFHSVEMRLGCLKDFSKKKFEPSACNMLAEIPRIGESDGKEIDRCYMHAAEKRAEPQLCEAVKDADAKAECMALTKKDTTFCAAIKAKEITANNQTVYIDEYTLTRGTCIQAVAYRTQDPSTCKGIDESLGTNWAFLRNHCLDISRSSAEGHNPNRATCDLYVAENGSWAYRTACQKGEYGIDENDFWQMELRNVLHVLPDEPELIK